MGNRFMRTVITAVGVVLIVALSYGGIAAVTWVICKCFDLKFTFKAAFGVWVLLTLIGWSSKE